MAAVARASTRLESEIAALRRLDRHLWQKLYSKSEAA
jgi:hypothetical protein